MPGRLPTKSDFAQSIELSITPPPSGQPATNVLILLHGLGDTNAPFTKLGQQLSLPETACIAVQAPAPLPFDLGGFHWGDDLIFDQNTGVMDMDTGFKKATTVIKDGVIYDGLIGKCGYKGREIMIFGFAQGGMVALQVAAELDDNELGGVVGIGGFLSLSLPLKALEKKSKTPALVCKASKASAVSDSAISRMKDAFEFLEVKEWNKRGDGMPSNREEMMPIMQFFARRLRSTRGVPAGSVEISSV
ncbi:alpha/beta-hydrolase [Aaosphaeria arxii CBS 175.79]|uniref:Alpha/beta-hydrolase n=1 Tax=Aaosphaeria arxii CBS 175.79 TaxID=1450172 RepID=A0A6A5Y7F8_9PLEO|nr:alpha/beta-hydrolase [Aaosphaeria arxii CBS 175.79]KAF2021229.1 alpha/beta-hydrolase [Aaosphaeria arxii CBS 175.79]